MTRLVRSLVALSALALGLSACGGGGGSTTPTGPVVQPVVPKIEDQFGTCFATRFRADPNSKATDPVPCDDLPPVSATSKPAVF